MFNQMPPKKGIVRLGQSDGTLHYLSIPSTTLRNLAIGLGLIYGHCASPGRKSQATFVSAGATQMRYSERLLPKCHIPTAFPDARWH